jgi:hypothetical protein
MTEANARPEAVDSLGMNYLVTLPRRIVTVYVPLGAFLFVLLFPFYWMIVTTCVLVRLAPGLLQPLRRRVGLYGPRGCDSGANGRRLSGR